MAETATVGMLRKQIASITELLNGLDNEKPASYEAFIALAMALRILHDEKIKLTAG